MATLGALRRHKLLLAAALWLAPWAVWAFAEDLCPMVTGSWRNCEIRPCAADNERAGCSSIAMLTTVASQAGAAMQGSGARSTVHFDATYFLAQSVGFSPRDAYWIAAYDAAVDLGSLTLRDQHAALLIDPEACAKPRAMNEALSPACMLATLKLGGANRNNFAEGGLFFHFQAPPEAVSPMASANGLKPQVDSVSREPFLYRLREWAYGRGPLCVGGLVDEQPLGCFNITVRQPPLLVGRVPFISDTRIDEVDWSAPITEQPLVTDPETGRNLPASELGHRLPPERAPLARLGIYLHALQDRISHHRCIDASELIGPRPPGVGDLVLNPVPYTAYQAPRFFDTFRSALDFIHVLRLRADPDFVFYFNPHQCGQLDHAARHALETGHDFDALALEDRTTEPALRATYWALQHFRQEYPVRITGRETYNEERVFTALMDALAQPTANGRINRLNAVAARQKWLPVPGYAGLSVVQWQRKAGSSALAARP